MAVAKAAVVGVAARQASLGERAVAEAGVAVMAGVKTCQQVTTASTQLLLFSLSSRQRRSLLRLCAVIIVLHSLYC